MKLMKTAVKIIAVIMVLATITVLFASCGKTLNGTYKPADGVGSLTFDKDGNVKAEGGVFGVSLALEGTYSIEKDKITIEGKKIPIPLLEGENSFEKSGKTIIIDGKEYVKE